MIFQINKANHHSNRSKPMPEYLAPGVYVEETSFRAKSIEGVGTTTTAFVGPTRRGPIITTEFDEAGNPPAAPELLTSYADFERMYGGVEDLQFGNADTANYLAHSVVQFFNEGGSRLYVARVANAPTPATTTNLGGAGAANSVSIRSRFAGSGANGRVTISEIVTPVTSNQLDSFPDGSFLRLSDPDAASASLEGGPLPADLSNLGPNKVVLNLTFDGDDRSLTFDGVNLSAVTFQDIETRVAAMNGALAADARRIEAVELPRGHFALRTQDAISTARLAVRDAGANEVSAQGALGLPAPAAPPAEGRGNAPAFYRRATVNGNHVWHVVNNEASLLTPAMVDAGQAQGLSFSVVFEGLVADGKGGQIPDGNSVVYDDIAFDRSHPRFAETLLVEHPTARADALNQAIWFQIGDNVDAVELHNALFPAGRVGTEDGRAVVTHDLTGGADGTLPMVGTPTDAGTYAAAFELLRSLEDISIIAAPGHSDYPAAEAIRNALVAHVERPRAYRIAVLDSPPGLLPGDVRLYRARFDSDRAALYYPWVTVPNPLARPGRNDVDTEINLPPSGFICGIYARNDTTKSVSKAPANEVVLGALRFESDINFAQQQLLNPLGINCLRYLAGRGYRVWGARTTSSDPEFKYVNVRRYFIYLEASIDRGTQWAVFENNGPRLWTNVRETV